MENTLQIIENNGIQTVSARELYKGLEISKRFSEWWKSNSKDFTENEDYSRVYLKVQANRYGGEQEIDDYAISIDMAKAICLMSRTDLGKKYRTYLINLEKAWNEPSAIMARALEIAHKTLAEALQLAADQAKQLEEAKPKVEYFDNYCNSENLIEIGHLGKTTQLGELKIFKRLLDDGIIKTRYSTDGIKSYDPCYGYEKFFKSIPVTFTKNNQTFSRDKLMLTHKGFVYFNARYAGPKVLEETAEVFIQKGETEYQNIVNDTAQKFVENIPGAMSRFVQDAAEVCKDFPLNPNGSCINKAE